MMFLPIRTTTTVSRIAPRFVRVVATTSTNNTTQYQSQSITVGSGADRALIVVLHGLLDASTGAPGTLTAMFGTTGRAYGTGTPMAQEIVSSGGARPFTAIFSLPGPASGAGTVQVVSASLLRGLSTSVYEYTGVDQTTPIATKSSRSSGGSTSISSTITTANANVAVISGVTVYGGGLAPTSTGTSVTQDVSNNTGATDFNDSSNGAGHAEAPSPGSVAVLHSWAASKASASAIVELKAA